MFLKKIYLWQGIDITQRKKLGLYQARNKKKLETSLNHEGIYQIKSTAIGIETKQKKLTTTELLDFLRSILAYLKIGVSLQEALLEISQQFSSKVLKYISYHLYLSMHKGEDLKTSFNNLSQNFPLFFLSIIKISPNVESLAKVFQDAIDFYEKLEQKNKKIKEAIQYPLFSLCFTITMVFFLLYFIMPMFQGIYANFENNKLPIMTTIAVFCSQFLRNYFFWIIGICFFLLLFHQKKWFYTINPLSLLSYLKNILQKKFLDPLLFSYALHNLLAQATPLYEALKITASMLTKENQKKILAVAQELHQGKSFYAACRKVNLYWKEFSFIFTIAEKTGDLSNGLKNIYKLWDEKLDPKINILAKILHLIIIVLSGAMIFFVFLAIYLPLLAIGSLGF